MLQYTTYVRYEVTSALDLMLDGADSRLNDSYFQAWAASFADFVCDNGPSSNRFARTIGGDMQTDTQNTCPSGASTPVNAAINRLGITYNHCYRPRTQLANHAVVNHGSSLLSGWDTRNRMGPYLHPLYPAGQGTVTTPRHPTYAAGRVFDHLYHGV